MCSRALARPIRDLHRLPGADPTGKKAGVVDAMAGDAKRRPKPQGAPEPQRSMAAPQGGTRPNAAGKTALGA